MPHVVHISPVDIPSRSNFFRTQLRELGYVEGRNIRLEFRNTAGNVDRLPALAEALVNEGGIDVILADSTPATMAAHRATQTIPIVSFAAVDPVAAGLAKSLAHPGGNVTGIAFFSEETTMKRVELMREVVPHGRLATVSKWAHKLGPVLEAGRKLGFTVEVISIDDPSDLTKALSPEVLTGFDAFVFVPDVVLTGHMAEITKLISLSNKPAIFPSRDWVSNGGFMCYGPDLSDTTHQMIEQLDRVLKGAKPGDLPYRRPTKFDLWIDLRIARALGIELSPTLLARADKVID
jgi:putative ABC transport system substrate-binding protein